MTRLIVARSDDSLHPPDVPSWVQAAYRRFVEQVLSDPGFPCYFAPAAGKRGVLRVSYVLNNEVARPIRFAEALGGYLAEYPELSARSALIAFVQLDRLDEDEDTFWRLLAGLRACDMVSWPPSVPDDPENPEWTFCFAGVPLFVAGHGPSYQRRRSRHFANCLMIVIQPRANLVGITGHGTAAESVRTRIRAAVAAYDGVPPSPNLGVYGDRDAREWRQYWLPDGDAPDDRECPVILGNPERPSADVPPTEHA